MVSPMLFKNVQTPPVFLEPGAEGLLYTGSPGSTFLVPYGVGSARLLAEEDGYGVLTSDGTSVYFVTYIFGSQEPFKLWRAPLSGAGPTVKLAEDPYMSGAPLAVDDKYVYWIGGLAGEVLRVAK